MKIIFSKLISIYKIWEERKANLPVILRVVALVGIGLMILGFAYGLLQPAGYSFPGPPTMSVVRITHAVFPMRGLVMMSVGVIIFALIPSVRILMGIFNFLHQHEIIDFIIAVIVLIELTVSILLIIGIKGVLT